MSSSPLANSKHERYSLLIAAGLEVNEAYQRAGYASDEKGGNASRLLKKPEIAARIAFLRGESSEPVSPSNDQSAITQELTLLAFDHGTPPAQRIRAFEILTDMNERAGRDEYWPSDTETFDLTRLSDKQRRLCELYAARPAQQSPAETIMERLAAMHAKAGNRHTLSESLSPKELVSAHRSQPSLVLEERTMTSTSMRLTSSVSAHGAR